MFWLQLNYRNINSIFFFDIYNRWHLESKHNSRYVLDNCSNKIFINTILLSSSILLISFFFNNSFLCPSKSNSKSKPNQPTNVCILKHAASPHTSKIPFSLAQKATSSLSTTGTSHSSTCETHIRVQLFCDSFARFTCCVNTLYGCYGLIAAGGLQSRLGCV